MRPSKFFFVLAFLPLVSLLHATDEATTITDFAGGLNVKDTALTIADNESPDMSNFVNDLYGASVRRNGSSRFIPQAISSNPISSISSLYITSNAVTLPYLVATTKNSIYYSTGGISPSWVLISSALSTGNQHFSMVVANNKLLLAGDQQTDNMTQYDFTTSSYTNLFTNWNTTDAVNVRPKYLMSAKNYVIGANCALMDLSNQAGLVPGTTYYPSRIYYDILLNPSSFTSLRYIDINANDGDQIMGISQTNKVLDIFKQNTIWELNFTALNLPSLGGDQSLANIVTGFGCIAPRSLSTDGYYYYFLAKDGIRIWDGGEKTRLNVADESEIISTKIQPLIDEIIRNNTYQNAVGFYYKKKGWYVFSYEDPNRSPHGRNNSVLVYEIQTKNWYRFRNWNVESWSAMDGSNNNGQLFYGDSNDGYVYLCDSIQLADDARKEMVVDTMDNPSNWTRGTQDITNVKEGTASIKITLSASVNTSSMTNMSLFNLGEWPDKSKVSLTDKLSFKIYPSSAGNLGGLRVDLEVNDQTGDFDNNFTSVTLSSAALTNGNTSWTTIEIALSSFPIPVNWIATSSEAFTFAQTLTYYGIRFVATGSADCSLSIDDVRLVGATQNSLNAYRYTKQFNIGNPADKRWRQVILSREEPYDNSLLLDVFTNFGQVANRINLAGDFDKSLYVGDFGGTNNITKLNSIDYSILDSTNAGNRSVFAARPVVVDNQYVYAGDQYNNRIFKVDKSTLSSGVFISSYGTLGMGATNFNYIFEMAVDDQYLYVADFLNNRISVHNKSDLSYANSFGTLGTSTNIGVYFNSPTGVAVDDSNIYVSDDGNFRLVKLDKSTGGFELANQMNINFVGDSSIGVDDTYLYDMFHSRTSSGNVYYNDIILEKRFKNDLSVVNKIVLRPMNNPAFISTYTRTGDISLSDNYIFIPFTDNANGGGNYYIQKRLKSDFTLVSELKSPNLMFTPAANGLAYRPKVKTVYVDLNSEGSYIQLKYYENNQLENNFKLLNQSFILEQEEIKEKN